MKEISLPLICLTLLSIFGCENEQSLNLKILSYNIRHGEGMDELLDLSRSAKIIKAVAPDLCGLQEVDNFCTRSNKVGQTDYLAEATGLTGNFGKFMDFQEGGYGMATLVAKPIISTKVVQLPDGKYEPRTAIVQEVQLTETCTISFANVHFEWISGEEGSANRVKQAKALLKHIGSLKHATVITGDFNCTPDSPTMQYFAEQGFVFVEKGTDNLSFQGEPKAEIDHVIFRDAGQVKFKRKSVELLEEPLVSDHRPLVTELEVLIIKN